MAYKKYSKEIELQIVEEYRSGASVNSLCEKYGFKRKESILNKVKKYYPETYKEILEEAKNNRKGYNYKLETISNEFDAYFIGLMLTDGYISNEQVGIDLVDEDCIAFLSSIIGKKYSTYKPDKNKGKKNRHRLILNDKILIKNLKRFGITPKKTLNLQPPLLKKEEEKFLPYIIRGIIDGDGSITRTNYGAPEVKVSSMSKDFINWLIYVLENKLFLQDIRVEQNNYGMFTIRTAHTQNILKIICLVYNKPFGMSRKYNHIRTLFRDYNGNFLEEF